MIYRISIPVLDPSHVAAVLTELTGGRSAPFDGGVPGAWMIVAGDRQRVAIEVYPTEPVPALRRTARHAEPSANFDPTAPSAFRFPLSVPLDRVAIERIAAREGWRTRYSRRGALGPMMAFHVVEFWIENRILAELTPCVAVAEPGRKEPQVPESAITVDVAA